MRTRDDDVALHGSCFARLQEQQHGPSRGRLTCAGVAMSIQLIRRWAPPLLTAVLLFGCAHSVKEVARESSRAAVDESVDELTDEDSKQQMANAVADPRFEQAIKNITDQVTEGVLKSL